MSNNREIQIGDIIIVKNLIFKFQNGKINPTKDHATNGRPCIVISVDDDSLFVLGVKGKYGYEKNNLKFMDAHNDSFVKSSLYQIEEIFQIRNTEYQIIGSLDNHELYELLYSLVWYQYSSEEYKESVKEYKNRLHDDKIKIINDDINQLIMELFQSGASKEIHNITEKR